MKIKIEQTKTTLIVYVGDEVIHVPRGTELENTIKVLEFWYLAEKHKDPALASLINKLSDVQEGK